MSSAALLSRINLVIEAGKAMPGPKVASVLGPRGIPMPKFCKEFNDATSAQGVPYETGDLVTARISVYADNSYSFSVSDSPVSFLLKKAAGVTKGSSSPGKESCTSIKMSEVVKIAERKMADMNADSVECAVKMVVGTAKSMGMTVEE
ncbi:50S ribosomal protein L11 [Anaplasma marginale str. Dawn]|uniref:Large ribosomal subunit protein uL11 n=3 Tax=Pseudomonadota TaxID=1224 RepID=B9KHV7_ANAMF|nr:50S ribosomal protein L11 [Anaplasma marginale]AAV86361.1 50S ribosomal protein L11 [Anaplasma marginale str. St. Maries]ACM49069.1 50S ribosomal protein L11 (rplK) [Anaplasma marginale str. Florida]AGZ78636.1 50S ribosomal protein L11 [Anaplasma marginale str. Gypsy Plains]AGZ79490.1 50S ribosomal protein L11 [Anaplasma marginale str. Dawn]AXW83836.1 50S ribosomal protein L11 [Anaplasma marginale]